MTRKEAIYKIMFRLDMKRDIVIFSNGMVSRDAFATMDRKLNFYMMGSMGNELAIGIGLAYARPDLKIVVVSGDGSALMGMNTKALQEKMKLRNLWHYILDNNCHASINGQPTCSDAIDFQRVFNHTIVYSIDKEKGDSPRISLTPKQISERFRHALSSYPL